MTMPVEPPLPEPPHPPESGVAPLLPPSPPPTGPAGGRRPSLRLLAVAAGAVLLVVAGVAVVVARDDQAGLRVVETGASEVVEADVIPLSSDVVPAARTSSWVVVVENPTDRVAVDVEVEVRLLGETGNVIAEDRRWLDDVPPRERVALAFTTVDDVTGVADVEAVLGEPERWEDAAGGNRPELSAEDLTVGYGAANQAIVGFTVATERAVDAYEWFVVLRDADGHLLAGWPGSSQRLPDAAIAAGGTADVVVIAPFTVPDVATVEVYVGPVAS